MDLDQGKNLSKADREELWENAHRKTVGWLFEAEKIVIK
jgi:hypothetical protein